MELLSPMKETVYGTGSTSSDDSHVMSEKVQNIAGNIYQEFEKMIRKYDEDVVKELMPLVVSVLEDLDLSYVENQEHEVELELLRVDNEQLVTQFEREKQLRKAAEQKLLEIEYGMDDDKRDLQSKVESLESLVRILELKARNSSDHASRLEEKEADMKEEYTKLHSRYTELLKTHMDYMERTKIMLGNDRLDNNVSLKSKHTLPFGPLRSGMPDSLSDSLEEGKPLAPTPLDYPSLSSFTSIEPALGTTKLHSLKSEIQTNTNQNDAKIHTSSSPKKRSDSETTSPEEEHKTSSVCREKRSTNTLYQEVSFEDATTDPDADENSESLAVADSILAGMGKEVEQLIHENNELLATKNALNIVKDDLIAKVDELTSEIEINKEEICSLQSQRDKLKKRIADLEEDLKKTKEELETLKAAKSDDEEEVPMAQRKRFTRVEMARVLMERNQFKERLMELEEAMKWADMMRASKNDAVEPKKTRGSIWKLFSSLFSSTDRPDRAIQYNAPSEQVSPALDIAKRKRTQNLDFMDSEITSERMQQQRARQRREHYKQVKAHVKKDDGRMQAYGWSLPSPPAGSPSEEDKGMVPSPLSVPAPVYCRPLIEKDPGLKIWCAAGIDLSGGKTPDGGSIVGASVFYSNPAPIAKPTNLSDVEKLDQQLKDQEALRREQEELEQQLSSLVWICTSTHSSSSVTVVDANNPGDVLDSFPVCSSHLLTIASIPGAKPTDFPVDDEFLNLGVENASQPSSPQEGSSSQDIVEGKMGSIKYISCATGASVSLLQPPCSATANSPENSVPSTSSEDRWKERTRQWVVLKDPPEIVKDGVNTLASHNPLAISQMEKMSTILPTMWLGAQNGRIYIHSSVAQWFRCIDSVQLQDAVLNIVHIKGRIFTSQANGTVAIFHRSSDGQWDLVNYHLLDLGQPHHSIRCMAVVHNKVWCGYRNRIHVIDAHTLSVEAKFEAHPRRDSQVRLLAWAGDGVWVSIRLDSTLRLYHAHTRQHLQDVDIEPYVTKMLGTGKLGFSFVRITALLISSFRLWIGTGNGVIISIPLSEKESVNGAQRKAPGIAQSSPSGEDAEDSRIQVYTDSQDVVTPASYIPYLSMSQAQLSFHGHRDAVKFFVAVPGRNTIRSPRQSSDDPRLNAEPTKYMLVMSGGEGYIDFRLGDGDDDEEIDKKPPLQGLSKGDWSHLIAWQVAIGDKHTH